MNPRITYAAAVTLAALALAACSNRQAFTPLASTRTSPPPGPVAPALASPPLIGPTPPPILPSDLETPPLPLGAIGPRSAIPWTQVGPGWVYAITSHRRLILVDPIGGAYDVTALPATVPDPHLASVSGDGRRALVSPWSDPRHSVEVDLRTGAVSRLHLPADTFGVAYTKPLGRALLVVVGSRDMGPTGVVRLSRDGRHRTPLTHDSSVLSAPDGRTLVIAASKGSGFDLLDNNGALVRRLRTPAAARACGPLRWWAKDVILAACEDGRLWLVPTDSRPATPLTHRRDSSGPDLGDYDAFEAKGQVYLNAHGACGTLLIAQEDRNGVAHAVRPPGPSTEDSNSILGVGADGWLLVDERSEGSDGGCADHDRYVWFDPPSRRTRPLATHLPGGGVVTDVLPLDSADGSTVSRWQ